MFFFKVCFLLSLVVFGCSIEGLGFRSKVHTTCIRFLMLIFLYCANSMCLEFCVPWIGELFFIFCLSINLAFMFVYFLSTDWSCNWGFCCVVHILGAWSDVWFQLVSFCLFSVYGLVLHLCFFVCFYGWLLMQLGFLFFLQVSAFCCSCWYLFVVFFRFVVFKGFCFVYLYKWMLILFDNSCIYVIFLGMFLGFCCWYGFLYVVV